MNRQRIFDVLSPGRLEIKGIRIMAEAEREVGTTRRAVLLGAGAVGAAGLLSACNSTPPGTGNPPPPPYGPPETQAPIHTSDSPVGGGVIFPLIVAVVTQPDAGTF